MMGDSPETNNLQDECHYGNESGSPGENGPQVVVTPPGPLVAPAGQGVELGIASQDSAPGPSRPVDGHPTGEQSQGSNPDGSSGESRPQVVETPPGPLSLPEGLRFAPGQPFKGLVLNPVDTLLAGGRSLTGEPLRFGTKRKSTPLECPKRPKLGVKQLTKIAAGKPLRKGRKPELSEDEIRATACVRLDDLLAEQGRTNVHFTFKEVLRLNALIRDAGNVKHDIAQSGNSLMVLVRLADDLWTEMRERYDILLQEAKAERVARLALEERVRALEIHESQTPMEVDGQVPLSEIHALREQNTILMQKVEELSKALNEHVSVTPTHDSDTVKDELLTLREENLGLRTEVVNMLASISTLEQAQQAAEASHSEELDKLRQENASLQAKLKSQEDDEAKGKDNSGGTKKKKRRKKRKKAPQTEGSPAGANSNGGSQDPTPSGSSGEGGERQGSGNDGFVVVQRKKAEKPKPRPKGEAVVIKADESQYATILKSMRTDPKLTELGRVTKSVRRTRKNELLLVLSKAARETSEYTRLVTEVLGTTGAEVRLLSSEVTLQCKNLDETTTSDDLLLAIETQCGTGKLTNKVDFKRYAQRTQRATFKLPEPIAAKVLKVGKLKVNWSICPVTEVKSLAACFKCFGYGHKSWACKGPDRSKLCRRCGAEGHKAKGCKATPKCLLCVGEGGNHATGSFACASYKSALQNQGS